MRGRNATFVLLLVACGSKGSASGDPDAAAPDATLTDAAPDVGADARGDISDAGVGQDGAADARSSLCEALDASVVLVCETFDDAGTLPLPFHVVSAIDAKLEITNAHAVTPPNALRVTLGDAGDAGYFSSATGTVAQATFANAIPRARLQYEVFLDGAFDGEVDASAIIWSSGATSYRVRFGINGGTFWEFDSSGIGYSSTVTFPTGAWYHVTIDVDLVGKRLSIMVGGVHLLDVPIAPPAMTPTSLELDLGVAAIASGTTGAAPAVLVDDVILSSY